MDKLFIIDEKDINALLNQAILSERELTLSKEKSQMLMNLKGVCVNSKPRKSDGRYQGYLIQNNKKTYFYGKTQQEVITKIKQAITKLKPNNNLNITKLKPNNNQKIPTTFTAFALYYFENFRKKRVTEKTFYCDTLRFNRYLKSYFREIPIKKITPKDCQSLIDDIVKTGKGKTADEVYSLLSVILKMAIKHGILTRNPLDIVFHEQHAKKHGKALTKEEENTLKTALNGSTLLPAFMILLYTGLRPNELATVKIDGNFIIAVNSKRKHKRIEYKRIPISKMLAPYLAGVDVPNLSSADYLRRKFKEILPGHILYDLRTTFYSRCKECGISEHARNAFMGHSLGALGNAYTDLSDDFLIKEMAKFEY